MARTSSKWMTWGLITWAKCFGAPQGQGGRKLLKSVGCTSRLIHHSLKLFPITLKSTNENAVKCNFVEFAENSLQKWDFMVGTSFFPFPPFLLHFGFWPLPGWKLVEILKFTQFSPLPTFLTQFWLIPFPLHLNGHKCVKIALLRWCSCSCSILWPFEEFSKKFWCCAWILPNLRTLVKVQIPLQFDLSEWVDLVGMWHS